MEIARLSGAGILTCYNICNAELESEPGREWSASLFSATPDDSLMSEAGFALITPPYHRPVRMPAVRASTTKEPVPKSFTGPFSGIWYSKALIGCVPGTVESK